MFFKYNISISLELISFFIISFQLCYSNQVWHKMNSPNGSVAVINTICSSPDGDLFIGLPDNGIFISKDNGATWEEFNDGLKDKKIFVIKSDNIGNVYVGGNKYIYRLSSDKQEWETVYYSNLADYDFTSISINNIGYVFVGTENRILRSVDNCKSWEFYDFYGGYNYHGINTISIKNDSILFIGSHNGICRSTDFGISWSQCNNGLDTKHIRALLIDSTGIIYAGTVRGIYLSYNDGESWIRKDEGLSVFDVSSLYLSCEDTIYAGTEGGGVYFTTDFAETWSRMNNGLINKKILILAGDRENSIYAGTEGSGVFQYNNSQNQWSEVNNGLTVDLKVSCLTIGEEGLFLGTSTSRGGVYQWIDDISDWILVNEGLINTNIRDMVYNNNYLYVVTEDGVYYSIYNDIKWIKISEGLDRAAFNLESNSLNEVFVGTGDGIYKLSSNKKWDKVYEDEDSPVQNRIFDMCLSFDGKMFAGHGYGVLKSVDNGSSWIKIPFTHINNIINRNVFCVAANKTNDLFAAVNYYNGPKHRFLYRLMHYDDTWRPVIEYGVHLSSSSSYVINDIILTSYENLVVAMNGKGISYSSDNGDSWIETNYGLQNLVVNALTEDSDNIIYAGTDEGVYYCENLSNVIVNNDDVAKIRQYFLHNYPNPFNPETTIKYSLPIEQPSYNVTVKIVDALGQVVKVLINQKQSSGEYTIKWNGQNSSGQSMPSGVYFCVIEAGKLIETQKMLLLR